jgi:hypothetical protein
MSVFSGIRRLLGEKDAEFGEGQRHPLTKEIQAQLKRQLSALRNKDLSAYTFERRHSDYKGATSDVVIYDSNEKPVFFGREMEGKLSFWTT